MRWKTSTARSDGQHLRALSGRCCSNLTMSVARGVHRRINCKSKCLGRHCRSWRSSGFPIVPEGFWPTGLGSWLTSLPPSLSQTNLSRTSLPWISVLASVSWVIVGPGSRPINSTRNARVGLPGPLCAGPHPSGPQFLGAPHTLQGLHRSRICLSHFGPKLFGLKRSLVSPHGPPTLVKQSLAKLFCQVWPNQVRRNFWPLHLKGGGPKGGSPKFRFFSLSRKSVLPFFPLMGVFSLNFGGVLKCRDPQMCAFGVLGLSCEAPAAPKSNLGWSCGGRSGRVRWESGGEVKCSHTIHEHLRLCTKIWWPKQKKSHKPLRKFWPE